MAIYSLPLAAVLVAAALRNHHTPSTAMQVPDPRAQDHTAHEHLLVLGLQLARLRRRVRSLRIQCALDRGVVAAQLHDADAQLALAQLQLNRDRATPVDLAFDFLSVDYRGLYDVESVAKDDNETSVAVALQRIENLLLIKKRLVRLAHDDADAAQGIIVDVQAACAMLHLEMDELQTRHHLELSALYDALTTKRLRLRAFDSRIQQARLDKRASLQWALRLDYEDDDDDDASMAMLEDLGDDQGAEDALYDTDDDKQDGGKAIVYEEASI